MNSEGLEGRRSIQEIPQAWADAGHSARVHGCTVKPRECVQAAWQVRAYLRDKTRVR